MRNVHLHKFIFIRYCAYRVARPAPDTAGLVFITEESINLAK